MILNGQNNHDWEVTSECLERTLKAAGRFEVSISTSPPKKSPKDAWDRWRPDFNKISAVVLDYNGEMWPETVRQDFLDFVWRGGGVVLVHAANNAFQGWKEWERITGLNWRDAAYGARIRFDPKTRRYVRVQKGEGPGAGHGRQHAFKIVTQSTDHPITKGFPSTWLHAQDELYHGQRGPAAAMTILNTAWSDPKTGGTDAHEPITWIIPYGEGQVVTTVLGHQWRGQDHRNGLYCVGFQTLLARSVEWAASREITLGIPKEFPRGDDPVLLEPESITW